MAQASSASTKPAKVGGLKGLILGLRRFSSQWWLPFVVGLLSFINTYTIVLSGPLTILFVSAILGRQSSWLLTAFLNAVGATVGVVSLIYLVNLRGVDYIRESFPQIFTSSTWTKTEQLMEAYGFGGSVMVASMPIVLHPLVLFGVISGMDQTAIVASVLIGRTIKYVVMGWCAINARKALRFFGVNLAMLDDEETEGGDKKD